MDVFEYARLRELYAEVYAPRNKEVVDEEVQEESPEELDEFFRVLKPGQSVKDAKAKEEAEREARAKKNKEAAKNKENILPYSKPNARTELAAKQRAASEKRDAETRTAGGGQAKEDEFVAKGYTRGQARRATMNQGRTNLRNKKKKEEDPNTQALKSLIKPKAEPETKAKPEKEQPPKQQPPKQQPPKQQPPKQQPPKQQPPKQQPPKQQPPKAAPPKAQTGDKAKDMATWAKANPTLANRKKTANPLMKGFSKPAAPKPETKPAPTSKPSPAAPAPAAKPMSRIAKATSNVKPYKPMKEEFDIIFDYLVESGFGPDEALRIMVEMPAEKREQILEKELSIDDQMRVSKEYNRMSDEEKKEANKKAMGDRPKAEREKDERTDAEKMADATGPRKGSRYRGD